MKHIKNISNILLVITICLFVFMVGFVVFAINHPELSLPIRLYILHKIYKAYIIVNIVFFILFIIFRIIYQIIKYSHGRRSKR